MTDAPKPVIEIKPESSFLSFFKILVGGTSATIIASVISYHVQMAQIETKWLESNKEFTKSFITHALDENLERRHRFAHYFSCVIGEGWTKYYGDLDLEVQTKKKELAMLEKHVASSPEEVTPQVSARIEQIQQEVLPQSKTSLRIGDGWIYAGKYEPNIGWSDTTVEVDRFPEKGQKLTVKTDTYLRDNIPFAGAMGKKVGVARQGGIVEVNAVWTNEQNNAVWVDVSKRP